MTTAWTATDMRPVVEVINRSGQHVYKVTSGAYLVGAGYFSTTTEVESAVKAIGYTMADIRIKQRSTT